MNLQIGDIIDRERGKICVVLASGPSLNPLLPKLQSYRDKGIVIMGCNEWYDFYKVVPDYWVTANSQKTIQTYKGVLDKHPGIIYVYAETVDTTPRWWIDKNINNTIVPYDQRHFNSNPCGIGKCCSFLIPGRLTIQEELQRYTGGDVHYGTGHSGAVHMLALAVLLGCREIYFAGVDLDYRLGYANGVRYPVRENILDNYVLEIYEDLKVIRGSAGKIGVDIYNTNVGSKYDIFSIKQL